MFTSSVAEHGQELTLPRVAARGRRPAGARPLNGAAQLLMLQRTAGNSAVAAHMGVAQRSIDKKLAFVSVPSIQRCGPTSCDCSDEERSEQSGKQGTEAATGEVRLQRVVTASPMVQRVPGDGMVPPGDCAWGSYLPLRLSVESAKGVVSMLGACAPGDSCAFLAVKIAAITAEIAARVALDTTCFRGGDTGHRQQVQDKINMVNRCHRFFQKKNCPQELVVAMEVVVAAARTVIEVAAATAAAAVIVAAVAALIAAIIALIEVIAALVVGAAEAAAIAGAAAALAALLILVREHLAPPDPPSPEGA